MAYDFKAFEKRLKEIEEKAAKELAGIRTGRATPAILDGVMVESYGTRVPITQVANVGVEDARSIKISPWDAAMGKEIEKAIMLANLGVSVGSTDAGVRVTFPELTGESRQKLLKLAKDRVEEMRTALRIARDEVWNDIQKQEKDKTITEDEKFRYKDEMQKRVDATNKNFESMLERKEKEIAQ